MGTTIWQKRPYRKNQDSTNPSYYHNRRYNNKNVISSNHRYHHRQRQPSIARRFWKSARYFCCLFGSYPLIVAPIVTLAWLLSLYSTLGCQFINLDVGFTPSNTAWNQSQAGLGLWHYHLLQQPIHLQSGQSLQQPKQDQTQGDDDTAVYSNSNSNTVVYNSSSKDSSYVLSTIYNGCYWYSDEFSQEFIERDRTWKVARIMALISGIGSFCAAITSWLFVLTPLPVSFFWAAMLLPLVIVSFIAEGSKFLMFDIGICRKELWYPSGVDSLPQTAESCGMGYTSYYAISAASVMLVALLSVCLHTPSKRALDPDFDLFYKTNALRDVNGSELEYEGKGDDDDDVNSLDYIQRDVYQREQLDSYPLESLYTDNDTVNNEEGIDGRTGSKDIDGDNNHMMQDDSTYLSSVDDSVERDRREPRSSSNRVSGIASSRDRVKNNSPTKNYSLHREGLPPPSPHSAIRDSSNDPGEKLPDPYSPRKLSQHQPRISESRLSKMEQMKLSMTADANEDMIGQFVDEMSQVLAEE